MATRLQYAFCAICSLLVAGGAAAYAQGENRSAASTEIFGYDWATTPASGVELRTDAFETVNGTNRVFHLDDLSVRGYDPAVGTAGVFSFCVIEIENGQAEAVRDKKGRELRFYWYDVPPGADSEQPQTRLVRAPGWYDADGTNRWENLEFQPSQAFAVQGNGLKFETFGVVPDTEVRVKVPGNRSVAVGQGWAKHANLCDIAMEGVGADNIADGIMLQTLNPDMTLGKAYHWYAVTNGVDAADPRYRVPGWYADASKDGLYTRESGVAFDMGRAFLLQGCGDEPGEAQVDCEFVLPTLQLFMKDYEPWSEQ